MNPNDLRSWLYGFSNLSVGGGGSALTVQDEGVTVDSNVRIINFIGADVEAMSGGAGTVSVYIPPPSFASHFNTTDGTTTGTVSESISRTTAFISTPTSEGNPFKTGSWAGSNQPATLSTTVTFTTGGEVTGFGAGSSLTVTVYDADGTSVLETKTTSEITANGSYGSGNIAITISDYAADTTRFKATPSITVAINTILTAAGLEGGRYHVLISMTTSPATDGSGPYTYTQPSVFIDANPNTPSLSTVAITETGGSVLTKHLSGVEYYILNSAFTASVGDIDNLNRNTARTSANIQLVFDNYGISTLSQSPLSGGAGNADFTGWTSAYNNANTSYSNDAATISSTSFRYRGTGARLEVRARDPWANSSYVNSSTASILIDTYTTTSTDLVEDFDDENRRQTSSYNGGNTAGNWTSTTSLSSGEAQVIGGQLIIPSAGTLSSGSANANWSSYSPTSGGANPNYSALSANSNYYRTIVDSSGSSRAGFTMTLTGNFVTNATADLAASLLQIFISKRASDVPGAQTGPTNTNLLHVHGAQYNFATFDDGVTNGQIRTGSSSGGTVTCTFGGFNCQTGFFMNILIADVRIKLDRVSVAFS